MPKRAVTGRVNLLPEGNDWSPRGLLTLIRPNPEIRGSRRSDAWSKCPPSNGLQPDFRSVTTGSHQQLDGWRASLRPRPSAGEDHRRILVTVFGA